MQLRIPLFTISFLVGQTQRALADSREYFLAMDESSYPQDQSEAKSLALSRGEVEFNNVSFGYDLDKAVLSHISFKIEPGTKTALVGESGEGKTTITNLLLGLYRTTSGTITIDAQEINKLTKQSLRANIGMVFQDPALFSGTIWENIAYANPKASGEQVELAAKAANAHGFIEKFDKKYLTEIGERGLKLSGGQKQRIAIARALLKDAPILILDEATSNLDSKAEREVQGALNNLMKSRTTLIIAHRLSTISHVDQIVTLKNGRVDEVGTPLELSKSGGIYEQLLKLQRDDKSQSAQIKLKKYEIAD